MSEFEEPAISIVTLGCAKNEVDSRQMGERLRKAGYRLVNDPTVAHVIIVNTCSFIQSATEESLDAIFSLAEMENIERGAAHIVVAGCMPARYGDGLADALNEATAFVPCSKEDDIVEVVDALLGTDAEQRVDASDSTTAAAEAGESVFTAYVKISDGCNRWCSYCTIPLIRGSYHSFALEDIVVDVQERVDEGAREVTLIAQDTGRWGQDFEDPSSLARLMDDLAGRFADTWFRVMYIQPEGITDELLSVIAAHENICSYLDIPLQHVAEPILRAMNRTGNAEKFLELLAAIRQTVPGVTLRTTFIAGFPGETEAQLEDLKAFLGEACFDYVGVFPYSCEEGTKAAELPGQLPEEEKLERAQELRDCADDISASLIRKRIGSTMDVLVLGAEEDGQLYGRTQCQAAEVDGVTYLSSGMPGDIVSVFIEDTLMYEMEGA